MKKKMKKGKITMIITAGFACFVLVLVMTMQFKIVNEFDHSCCLFLSNILPQFPEISSKDYQEYLKFAQSCMTNPIAWSSSVRLLGVLHYIQEPDMESKQYVDFFNKKVILRLKKPHKISAALDYILAYCPAYWIREPGSYKL